MRLVLVLLGVLVASIAAQPSFASSFVLELEAVDLNGTFTFAWDGTNERIAEWMETTSEKGAKQSAIAVILPTKGVEIVGFDVYPLNITCCTQAIPQSSTIGTFWQPQAPYKNTTCAGRVYPTCYSGAGTAKEPSRLPEMVWCFDYTGRPACGARLDDGQLENPAIVTSYLEGVPPSIFFQVPAVFGSCTTTCAPGNKAAAHRPALFA